MSILQMWCNMWCSVAVLYISLCSSVPVKYIASAVKIVTSLDIVTRVSMMSSIDVWRCIKVKYVKGHLSIWSVEPLYSCWCWWLHVSNNHVDFHNYAYDIIIYCYNKDLWSKLTETHV